MNPDPISAGNRFVGGKCLRLDSRPSHADQAVMPRHPGWWIIAVLRMDEDRCPAQPGRTLKITNKIRPRQLGHEQVAGDASRRRDDTVGKCTGLGHGNDRLRPWRKNGN